jgi:hypothetical protein
MELPIMEPAPVVTEHAAVFRDLFDNQCQFRHFQHYLTGLIVLPNKSLANMARCILGSTVKPTSPAFSRRLPGGRTRSITAASGSCSSRPSPIAVADASRSWSSTIRCANMWGVSLPM